MEYDPWGHFIDVARRNAARISSFRPNTIPMYHTLRITLYSPPTPFPQLCFTISLGLSISRDLCWVSGCFMTKLP